VNEILDTIGEWGGDILGSPPVQVGVRVVAAYLVVVWLAAAYWAFRDMERRTTNLLLHYASAALVLLCTPFLFPAGLVIHAVMRPPATLAETEDEGLRRAVLEADAAGSSCPECGRTVDDRWIVCPTCARRLQRTCPSCARLVGLDWELCAYCAADFRAPPELADAGPALVGASSIASVGADGGSDRRLGRGGADGDEPADIGRRIVALVDRADLADGSIPAPALVPEAPATGGTPSAEPALELEARAGRPALDRPAGRLVRKRSRPSRRRPPPVLARSAESPAERIG
jgi:hypothetical protein